MPDTQVVADHITPDAATRYKLTQAAIDRLRARHGVHEIEDLADKLRFSRQTFWRLRTGRYDIPLSRARELSAQAELPLTDTFEAVPRG